MEGLLQNTKESRESKEAILEKKIEKLRSATDLLGREIDENILECVAVLNLLEIHTSGSCGGHTEENGEDRISFPYL